MGTRTRAFDLDTSRRRESGRTRPREQELEAYMYRTCVPAASTPCVSAGTCAANLCTPSAGVGHPGMWRLTRRRALKVRDDVVPEPDPAVELAPQDVDLVQEQDEVCLAQ